MDTAVLEICSFQSSIFFTSTFTICITITNTKDLPLPFHKQSITVFTTVFAPSTTGLKALCTYFQYSLFSLIQLLYSWGLPVQIWGNSVYTPTAQIQSFHPHRQRPLTTLPVHWMKSLELSIMSVVTNPPASSAMLFRNISPYFSSAFIISVAVSHFGATKGWFVQSTWMFLPSGAFLPIFSLDHGHVSFSVLRHQPNLFHNLRAMSPFSPLVCIIRHSNI